MQRGSNRLSAHRDEELKHELRDLLRSGHPAQTEEWHGSEPAAEDDPELAGGPIAPGGSSATPEAVRLELSRYLSRHSFPADPFALALTLRDANAPDALADPVARLPRTARYTTVQELTDALISADTERRG
ncbi:DUF2795 domain-containing protein [Streptomyces pseudovenezuelae]|uniref:DUF2795 domain-containing protein n=1 Tax=Streptomyces pseudovenezuelae TaxID=67350 RepID=A0ABT6LAD7_9ACTN|nr:DUF2795 domain-containing protein [Streptomyces pseudovenezuelae]MDH6213276.1 hypothetical protein [Streptomyces pseudovenezuelae]